ncbi:MAG: hypothetical protein HY402_05960, partial [Elusimicrobia bacterium]|nr:hypothetical protein [Elusimicrobiota bacterium]
VAITTPTAGATLSGLIQITGTVADADGDLASVEVSTNGGNSFAPAVWGVGAGNLLAWAYPSFSASLDTTQVPNGTYTLMARAKDAAGNVGGPVLISVTVQNQTVSGSRTFWMGTTPFTFQPGTFIEARFENPSDKDLLSLHADDFWGVPWDSFLNDTPLPTPWASRWQAVASSATASGKTLYLALSPLSDRKTLTRRVNPDGSTTDNWAPADSEGCYLFSSDPNAANYKAAYIRYVQYLVDLVHPRFLSPALELSLQFAKCPAQKQAFMQWYADVHNALKAANPNLIIFPTFQMEFMYGVVDPAAACSAGTSYADCFRQRLQEALGVPSDRIAFSMYPHLWGNLGPSIADLDPFSTVQSLTSKTIWIGETGWNTVRILSQYAPTCGTDWIPASVANEAKQNEYMSWLLGQAQSRQFEAVVWWLNRDTLDAATAATCPCSGDSATCTFTADFYTLGGNLGELVLRMFGNMALRTYDGSPRPAHATWTSYMNLTFTGDTGGGGDIVVTTSTSVVVGTSGGVLGDLQTHGASVVISEGTLSQSLTISIAPATPDGTQSQAMQSQGFTSASPTVNLYAVGFESGYHFSRNVTVTLRYDPNVVQNTSALTIAWWDTGQGQWQPIAPGNCRVDPGSSTIACTVDHFTTFGVFEVAVPAAASLEFGEVFVYPNPAAHPQQPTLHIEVGTVEEVEIQIYDLAGTAVDRIELRGGPRVGINGKLAYEHVWDTQNVAAGGYAALIRASSGGSSIRRTVKFAVVK